MGTWGDGHFDNAAAADLDRARRTVDRVLRPPSELADLWAASPDARRGGPRP